MSKMFQFSRPPSKYIIMITILILETLITFTVGEITRINVIEGEDIQLNFSYPCNSSKITLRYGSRAPFYDSTNPESMTLPENQELTVEKGSDECFIRLFFNPALRSDGGGYIMTSHTDGRHFGEDTTIWLGVDYPPARASCEWSGEHTADDWASLKCTAPVGSLSGGITCYQNGIMVPYLEKRTAGNILEQTNWVRYSQPAFCCAVVIGSPGDRCDCKDYKWDPYKNLTDPCPVTTPQVQRDSTPWQSYTPLPTITKNEIKNDVSHKRHWTGIAISAFIIIGLTIAFIIPLIPYCRRVSKPMKHHGQKKSETTRDQGDGYMYMQFYNVNET